MPKYRVINPAGLNQRAFPSVSGPVQTRLQIHTVVETNDVPLPDIEGRLWVRINGADWKWVCLRDKDGTMYLEQVADEVAVRPAPTTPTQPRPTNRPDPNLVPPTGGRVTLVPQNNAPPLTAIDGVARQWLMLNVRELIWFGSGYQVYNVQHTRPEHIDHHINRAKAIGARIIRFFVPLSVAPLSEAVQRTGVVLDKLHAKGMLGMPCLNDSIGVAGMNIAAEGPFHTGDLGHLVADYYVQEFWRQHYLPFVDQIVSQYDDHPAVYGWQLINEAGIYPQPPRPGQAEAFAKYVREVSALIANRAPKHLIGVGLISSAHVGPGTDERQYARTFYGSLPNVHLVGGHIYQDRNNGNVDALWEQEDRARHDYAAAQELGKAYIMDEFGACAGDRLGATGQFCQRWLVERKSASVGQWGFMHPDPAADIGIGDGIFGFDPVLGPAQNSSNAQFYTAICDLLKARLGV